MYASGGLGVKNDSKSGTCPIWRDVRSDGRSVGRTRADVREICQKIAETASKLSILATFWTSAHRSEIFILDRQFWTAVDSFLMRSEPVRHNVLSTGKKTQPVPNLIKTEH